MRVLISAIITGFGLKLGTDIYKYVKQRVGVFGDDQKDGGDEAVDQAGGTAGA
ncbi:MAG TPA: hypothetical protein VGB85_22695 [Nannocystis sp.]|jgi:hypothetical protein